MAGNLAGYLSLLNRASLVFFPSLDRNLSLRLWQLYVVTPVSFSLLPLYVFASFPLV